MSLLLIVWTRLSHGSVVIRSSLEILIPREDGIMSKRCWIDRGRSGCLNSSSSTSGHSSINTSHCRRFDLRIKRMAVRGRVSDLEYSPGDIQYSLCSVPVWVVYASNIGFRAFHPSAAVAFHEWRYRVSPCAAQ